MPKLTSLLSPAPRYRWWHAATFGIAANASYGLLTGRNQRREDQRFYEQGKQAPFAPPAWAFGPAWAINNASVLWGDLALVNEPPETPRHDTLLALQGLWWTFYATFGYVYFRKRSPMLALIWTVTHYALTIATTAVAVHTGRDRLAKAQLTSLAWLTLATPVAAYQARHNPDPVLGYNPAG